MKTSSRNEELYEDSCEDEDAKMAMIVRRYKKLSFQRDQRMGRRNFRRDRFRNEPPRNNQITCYGCKQPGHLRSECPMNKESKKDKDKDKKKKKAMMATWSDSDPFSSESDSNMEIKANLCLMAIEDEVCIDDLDGFDKLQNEYECLFNDFEKLRHRCKDYKKIIITLTLDIEKTKLDYVIHIDEVVLNVESSLIANDVNDSWLWHRRLGHASMKTLNKFVKKDLVIGLSKLSFEKDKIYNACQFGKQVRNSFKSKNLISTSRPLELLHVDLFGPMDVLSMGGKSYGFVIVDDYSRFTWVYFLAHKDEVLLHTFIRHCKKVQNEKGTLL